MSTIYDKTDNYGLNLYGDNDPADLRDGYNGSMRTIDGTLEKHLNRIEGIDATLETHLNRIEGVESRGTHDEEVVKALIGDNTVDAATAAKNKWDKAATDAGAIGDIGVKVNQISTDIEAIKPQVAENNVKFTGNTPVQVGASPYYSDFNQLIDRMDNCIKRGISHIILVVDFNDTNSIKYLTIDQYVQAAQHFVSIGGTISAINFHNVNWSLFDIYKNTVNSAMARLSAYTANVILFNEQPDIHEHMNLAIGFINELKSAYKVGISFNITSLTQDNVDQLLPLLDYIGLNVYIFAGKYGENLTLPSIERNIQNSKNFNYLMYIVGKYRDKCYINELGIKPYFNYFNSPDRYGYDGALSKSPEAVTLYLSAMFELLGTKVKRIFLWFDPQDEEENEVFFNQLTGTKIGD